MGAFLGIIVQMYIMDRFIDVFLIACRCVYMYIHPSVCCLPHCLKLEIVPLLFEGLSPIDTSNRNL